MQPWRDKLAESSGMTPPELNDTHVKHCFLLVYFAMNYDDCLTCKTAIPTAISSTVERNNGGVALQHNLPSSTNADREMLNEAGAAHAAWHTLPYPTVHQATPVAPRAGGRARTCSTARPRSTERQPLARNSAAVRCHASRPARRRTQPPWVTACSVSLAALDIGELLDPKKKAANTGARSTFAS